jgi:hypothetical protein
MHKNGAADWAHISLVGVLLKKTPMENGRILWGRKLFHNHIKSIRCERGQLGLSFLHISARKGTGIHNTIYL